MFSTKNAFVLLVLCMVLVTKPVLAAGPPAARITEPGEIEAITHEQASPTPAEIHKQRVAKCRRIIESFYNYNGRANFGPHIEFFISYHERLEKDRLAAGDQRAKGFGEAWWWSLVYGGANFGMTCYGVAPGNCAGPLDVKHWPLVLDPEANIKHHCNEMFDYYLNHGVRGIDLCKWVMYPAAPFDWGGGMFRRTNQKHESDILRAYKFGKL